MAGYMAIILELAAPGSHQWKLLDRESAALWVLRTFADVSACILHGLFMHHLAWKRSVCIPPSQRREQGLSRAFTITCWVLSAQSGATGIWGPFVSLGVCDSRGGPS